MSAVAVVCPHCGARQSDRDPIAAQAQRRATSRDDGVPVDPYRGEPKREAQKPSPKSNKKEPLELTGEEARALLEVTGVAHGAFEYERPAGPLVLLLPRAEASGWTRTLEWALTGVALPMIVLGAVAVSLRPRLWGYVARGSEWGLTAMSGFLGGLVLWAVGRLADLGDVTVWALVAISGGALLGRAVLRSLPPRL